MSISQPKIVFLGTPNFARIILEKLIDSPYKPSLIITAPDKLVGRKHILTPPPVKVLAQKYNIPILQPKKILNSVPTEHLPKGDKFQILNSKPDLCIVAAYGKILPKKILEIPSYGFINVHPSLLPRWRGPSPIQYAILNGDEKTGVTIMLVDEKMDHGPILATRELQIPLEKITAPELHDTLAVLGAELLLETIPKWINGEIKPQDQDHAKATLSKMITREDGCIDWNKSAQDIDRMYRAFTPWPGVFTFWQDNPPHANASKGKRLKILSLVKIKSGTVSALPGSVVNHNGGFAVHTKEGLIVPEKVQLEGKTPQSAQEFLRMNPNIIGVQLK